jgi:hypothetical protein
MWLTDIRLCILPEYVNVENEIEDFVRLNTAGKAYLLFCWRHS